MTEALTAERSERVDGRLGYRSGSYSRSLITRVGPIELRLPRDRSGLLSTELFDRYQRSERALVSALGAMYVQGVSTRKVKAVTETLCGHRFSAASVSEMNQTLDAALTAFAIREVLPEAAWPRCYVHVLRNALDHLPRRANDDCLQELRWIYDRRALAEVRRDLAAWLGKWASKYARLCTGVEENIEETLSYYRLPLPHHKHMKSTNMLERLNQEIKRRTHVVRIFPSPPAACG